MKLVSHGLTEFSILDEEEVFLSEVQTLHSMGIDYISIGKIFPRGAIYSFFSNIKWAEFYRENRFFLNDPCLHSLYKTINILASWRYFNEDSPVMQKRREMCQINDGLSLYDRHNPNSYLIIGIASSDSNVISRILDSPKELTTLFCLKKEIYRKLSSPLFCQQAGHFHHKHQLPLY